MNSSAFATGASGGSVTGSTIIPDSERFTLSTSATWSAIDRLRWTIPIPPSRASAIARRASVTVSIAAETIGIASSMRGVRRVAVETSFGSTCDSAGTSSTSSKVSPSRPNFSSSRRRRSISTSYGSAALDSTPIRQRISVFRRRSGRSALVGDGLELLDLHLRCEPRDIARVEPARADLERRDGAGRDGERQRLLDRAPVAPGGDEARDEGVARSDSRSRLEPRRAGAEAARPALLAETRDGAGLLRDQ